jgi:uncharacterized protein YdhG (YjbR/CyaY superfamily)
MMENSAFSGIDQYIDACAPELRERLQALRAVIRANAPGARELISYGMPAFAGNGVLVYFAAFRNHVGFYPTASGIAAFAAELAGYRHAKGSVQFPHSRELPLELVGRITAFRTAEDGRKEPRRRR